MTGVLALIEGQASRLAIDWNGTWFKSTFWIIQEDEKEQDTYHVFGPRPLTVYNLYQTKLELGLGVNVLDANLPCTAPTFAVILRLVIRTSSYVGGMTGFTSVFSWEIQRGRSATTSSVSNHNTYIARLLSRMSPSAKLTQIHDNHEWDLWPQMIIIKSHLHDQPREGSCKELDVLLRQHCLEAWWCLTWTRVIAKSW